MTPSQIIESARNNLNAINDTLWSEAELLVNLYQVQLHLARRTQCIETRYSTTSVASQSEYSKPTNAIEVWRVTYAGAKLQKISFRELDILSPNDTSTSTGTPSYYWYYDQVLGLHPTPSTTGDTIQVYSFDEPSIPTISSTLEVPTQYHDVLVCGLTYEMVAKEVGHPNTIYWQNRWLSGVAEVEAHVQKKRRSDRFSVVATEENALSTNLGII